VAVDRRRHCRRAPGPADAGRELIRLQATLHGIPKAEGRQRGDELLDKVGLINAADRRVGTYSGGMQDDRPGVGALVHDRGSSSS